MYVIAKQHNNGTFNFTNNPRKHDTEESAKDEAVRLATKDGSSKFVVFQAILVMSRVQPEPPPVTVEDMRKQGLSF